MKYVVLWATVVLAAGCGKASVNSNSGSCTVSYCESFTLTTGVPWPSPWQIPSEAATPILNADIQSGRARLRATTNNVGRLVARTPQLHDFEALYTVVYSDFANQGIGFYGRQNGGRLTATTPAGQGYVIYFNGFDRHFGFWHEDAGTEIEDTFVVDPLGVGGISNNVEYRIRFQVEQVNATQTQLRARIWLASGAEPGSWNLTYTSSFAALQNKTDGFAVDVYNYSGTGSIYIDDIQIRNLD